MKRTTKRMMRAGCGWVLAMIGAVLVVALLRASEAPARAQQDGVESDTAASEAGWRFAPALLSIESDGPLAAYQVELRAGTGVRFVGVEGNGSLAFRDPPYYDPAALSESERLIVASYSTAGVDRLPTGSVRVATIHLAISGAGTPAIEARLMTAAGPDGRPTSAVVRVSYPEGVEP